MQSQKSKLPPIQINGQTFEGLEVPPGSKLIVWDEDKKRWFFFFWGIQELFNISGKDGLSATGKSAVASIAAVGMAEWGSIYRALEYPLSSKQYSWADNIQLQLNQWTNLFEAARQSLQD